MSTKRARVAAVGGAVLVTIVVAMARPAAADVITPAGACAGSGTWQSTATTETSAAHAAKDVIVIPRADTVQWSGNQKGYALGAEGPRRTISGAVQLKMPIGTATIDSWDGSSVRYANEGRHSYDLPSVLAGIKMKLKGFHKENGKMVCGGSVYVKIAGSSPLRIAGLGGLVLSGGLLALAGKPRFAKVRPAFEDINKG